MSDADFDKLADLVLRRSGLVLTPEKNALAHGRLGPVAQRFGFRDTAALLAELPYPSEELARAVTEALTINETSFFRDGAMFDYLARAALPALVHARHATRRIRIWSAAASTGQEAYSLAALIESSGILGLGWKVDLIATDLSEAAIARAQEGIYAPHEIERGLPADYLERYFSADAGQWRVAERLRRMVTFRVFNLLDHFGWLGDVDLILCRNVLFYIDANSRTGILAKMDQTLAPDGYLVLGANETMGDEFVAVTDCVYVKPRSTGRLPQRLAG